MPVTILPMVFITARVTKRAKVMFSQALILFNGGGGGGGGR